MLKRTQNTTVLKPACLQEVLIFTEMRLSSPHWIQTKKSTLEDDKLFVLNISDNDEYLWRKGLIAFNNKRLEEILLSLEKYFDIKIQIESDKLFQHTYTGKFRQSDGVDYALRVLQKSISFTYERDEDTGDIYIK